MSVLYAYVKINHDRHNEIQNAAQGNEYNMKRIKC